MSIRRTPDEQPAISGDDRLMRGLPSVSEVVDTPCLALWLQRVPRRWVVDAARRAIAACRRELVAGAASAARSVDELAARAASELATWDAAGLRPLINATGIVLHTGLGRAPLAQSAVDAISSMAGQYASTEIDLTSGRRGKRTQVVCELLRELTGAESAAVVNNNAAATVLVLAAVARTREPGLASVIVSRGELIEIGGSFRLPQIMECGGTRLREVGTTNKTRLVDYEGAIDGQTVALMKVHTSNYRVTGFTEEVDIRPLVELGHRFDLPVIHDIGSGAMFDFTPFGLAHEPTVPDSIRVGADLVMFSGDKLLGGPQAGIIVGRKVWIERIESHPLMRALRVDKLTLAALESTLRLHHEPQWAREQLPVLMLTATPLDELERRGRCICTRLSALGCEIQLLASTAYLGGGSLPTQGVDSVAIRLRPAKGREDELARRLRSGEPAVVARVQDGAVWLDLRTVFAEQDESLVEAVGRAVKSRL